MTISFNPNQPDQGTSPIKDRMTPGKVKARIRLSSGENAVTHAIALQGTKILELKDPELKEGLWGSILRSLGLRRWVLLEVKVLPQEEGAATQKTYVKVNANSLRTRMNIDKASFNKHLEDHGLNFSTHQVIALFVKNKEDAILKCREDGLALKDYPQFQNDVDVVSVAVQQNGQALQYATSALRRDETIVEQALKKEKDRSAFRFAEGAGLYACMPFLRQDPALLKEASVQLKCTFAKLFLTQDNAVPDTLAFLLRDRDVEVFISSKENIHLFKYLPEEGQKKLIDENFTRFKHANDKVRSEILEEKWLDIEKFIQTDNLEVVINYIDSHSDIWLKIPEESQTRFIETLRKHEKLTELNKVLKNTKVNCQINYFNSLEHTHLQLPIVPHMSHKAQEEVGMNKKNPSVFKVCDPAVQEIILNKVPQFLWLAPTEMQRKFLNNDPKLFAYLNSNQREKFLKEINAPPWLDRLPWWEFDVDIQEEIFSEQPRLIQNAPPDIQFDLFETPVRILNYLKYASDEVQLGKIEKNADWVFSASPSVKLQIFAESRDLRILNNIHFSTLVDVDKENFINKFNGLSEDDKITFVNMKVDLFEYAGEGIQRKVVKKNPEILVLLSKEICLSLLNKNPSLLHGVDKGSLIKIVQKHRELLQFVDEKLLRDADRPSSNWIFPH